MAIVACKICRKNFYAKPSQLSNDSGIYCSSRCHHLGLRNGKTVKCSICQKEVYRALNKLERVKSRKYFCSKSCQTTWRNTEFVGEKHANWKHGKSAYKSILKRYKVDKICTLCGSGDTRVLAVHHIDENHGNNTLKNLSWLCHNCHHLVHHDNVEKQKFLKIIAQRGF